MDRPRNLNDDQAHQRRVEVRPDFPLADAEQRRTKRHSENRGRGPWWFKLLPQLYHGLGTMLRLQGRELLAVLARAFRQEELLLPTRQGLVHLATIGNTLVVPIVVDHERYYGDICGTLEERIPGLVNLDGGDFELKQVLRVARGSEDPFLDGCLLCVTCSVRAPGGKGGGPTPRPLASENRPGLGRGVK